MVTPYFVAPPGSSGIIHKPAFAPNNLGGHLFNIVHIALLLTAAATAPVAMLLQNRHITAQRIDRVLKPIIGERQFFGELLHRGQRFAPSCGPRFQAAHS
jgi:hypothetical protein